MTVSHWRSESTGLAGGHFSGSGPECAHTEADNAGRLTVRTMKPLHVRRDLDVSPQRNAPVKLGVPSVGSVWPVAPCDAAAETAQRDFVLGRESGESLGGGEFTIGQAGACILAPGTVRSVRYGINAVPVLGPTAVAP